MTRIDHGNGTAVVRQYDAADRPTLIRHEDAAGNAMLELAYTISGDGLVTRIVETDEVTEAQGLVVQGQPIPPIVSQVDFEYDNRNRLTREVRTEDGSRAVDTGPDGAREGGLRRGRRFLIRVTQRQGGGAHLPLWQSFPDRRPRRHYP